MVEIPAVVLIQVGGNRLKGAAVLANKPEVLQKFVLETALVVDSMTVAAKDDLSTRVAMEAVPVVPFKRQHVLRWQSVRILLNASFVPFGANFLVQFDQVVLNSQV